MDEISRLISSMSVETKKNKNSKNIFYSNANIPNSVLYDLLDKVAIKYEDYYVFNYSSFRKLIYHELFDPFIQLISDSYRSYKREQYLMQKPVTYNMVTTIFRQICGLNKIPFEIKRKFDHSFSNNDYYIYII